jgi:hypothetical protein
MAAGGYPIMPAAYKRCVKHVEAKGKSTSSAHAICTSVNAGNIRRARKEEAKKKFTSK